MRESSRTSIAELRLVDHGGTWQQHNPWLEGFDGPLEVAVEGLSEPVALRRAGGVGQWTSEPSALDIARHFGHQGSSIRAEDGVTCQVLAITAGR